MKTIHITIFICNSLQLYTYAIQYIFIINNKYDTLKALQYSKLEILSLENHLTFFDVVFRRMLYVI